MASFDDVANLQEVTVVANRTKQTVFQPRMRLNIGGKTMGLFDGTVTLNGHYNASTFTGKGSPWILGIDFWTELGSDGKKVPVTVERGEYQPDIKEIVWDTCFDGILDSFDVAFDKGEVSVDCRDRIALLIDRKVYGAYPNKSAAEIITAECAIDGITAVISGGKELAGRIYIRDHTTVKQGAFSQSQTAWDLISKLARSTDNVVQMDGSTLYVKPQSDYDGNPWVIKYAPPVLENGNIVTHPYSNVIRLKMTRKLLATKDILVRMRSYSSKTGKGITVTAGNKSSNAGQTVYEPPMVPNVPKDKLQDLANKLYSQYTTHEYVFEVEAHANWSVEPYRTVSIQGGNGEMAQTFYVDKVSFTIGQDSGATMKVTIKNHPNVNEATA